MEPSCSCLARTGTAGGKNITPSEIENALRFSTYIKEAIIIADRRRFVSALIQIEFGSTSKWAEEQGLTYSNFRSLVELDAVRALIQREVDAVNSKMPQVQRVRKFHLLTKELDHDDGDVTATVKVRRKSIGEKYAVVIEQLYEATMDGVKQRGRLNDIHLGRLDGDECRWFSGSWKRLLRMVVVVAG
jgi:long-subunit acyl-CoA synthetase (AMP-forming)